MAEFLSHSNPLRRLTRRWNIASLRSGGGQIREVASWLSPSIRTDVDWADDDRQLWGYTADYSLAGVGFPAVAVFSFEKEVLLRKIDFYCVITSNGQVNALQEVCLLTPPYGYNPVLLDPGEYFPFLQTQPGTTNTLSIPRCKVISGYQTGLMSVTIGGTPIVNAIGPRYLAKWNMHDVLPSTSNRQTHTILDWDDPPIILPPYRIFAVQSIFSSASGVTLFVNLFLSERDV